MVMCNKISSLPDLHFTISDRTFTLKAEDYVLQVSSGGQTQCLLGIMALDMPAGHDEIWYVLGQDGGMLALYSSPIRMKSLPFEST